MEVYATWTAPILAGVIIIVLDPGVFTAPTTLIVECEVGAQIFPPADEKQLNVLIIGVALLP
jgi:hypothetical protein